MKIEMMIMDKKKPYSKLLDTKYISNKLKYIEIFQLYNMNKNLPKQYISQFNPIDIEKNYTVLNNEKKTVFKKLTTGIINRNITDTLNSAIELHCSGYIDNVIQKLSQYYFNEINIAQLQGINYIHTFMKYYNDTYVYKIKKTHPLLLVNDQVIRNFICFFVVILLTSNQRKLIKLPKIKTNDFDLSEKKEKKELISTTLHLVYKFVHRNEPKEIIIPLSEICHLFQDTSFVDREHKIIYWISWLLEYEKVCHNNNLLVGTRPVAGIDSKYHKDFIWIIWNIIKHYANTTNNDLIEKLFELYTSNYTRGTKKSRSNLIILAVLLVVNPTPSIQYPISPLSQDQYAKGTIHCLRANKYYLKLFQHKVLNSM